MPLTIKSATQKIQNLIDKGISPEDAKALVIDGEDVLDADGNPVDIDVVSLTTGGGAAEEEAATEEASMQEVAEKAAAKAVDAVTKTFTKKLDGAFAKAAIATPGTQIIIPARARGWGVKNFTGATPYEAEAKAYGFGQFIISMYANQSQHESLAKAGKNAKSWLRANGIQAKAQSEGVDADGGFLTPDEWTPDLIRLIEEYGVFRRNVRIEPMGSDAKWQPKQNLFAAAVHTAELATMAESTNTFERVEFLAKKITKLITRSIEVDEDSIVAFGDQIAQDIAWAIAFREDLDGFTGDGSGGFGGITGAIETLLAVGGAAGLNQVTAATSDAIVLTDFTDTQTKVISNAHIGAKWYVKGDFYYGVMQKLLNAAGGNTKQDLAGGVGLSFNGVPVELTEVMPGFGAAVSEVVALYGNLAMGASMGLRRGVTITTDMGGKYFDTDRIAVKGTERYDIQCHTLATASKPQALAALQLADA